MSTPTPSKTLLRLGLAFSRWWSITALVMSLTMLAVAHAFQTFDHLEPCHLCLKQRDIYWIASGVALVASVWALFTGAKGPPRVFSFVLFAIFTTGAALAFFHAGVELKWWHGPASCTASGAEISFDQMAAFLAGAATKAPMCDVAQWHMFGLSMAGYNTIVSSLLALLSLIASLRFRPRPKR